MNNKFKIENTEIYGVNKSVIASGNPMRTELANNDFLSQADYWLNQKKDFLIQFSNYLEKYDKNKGLNNRNSCCFCGSGANVQKNNKFGDGKYFCSKHNHQLYRFGKVFETSPKFVLNDYYVSIFLPNDNKEIKISYDSLEQTFYNYPTSITSNGYVKLKNGQFLHNYVLDKTLGKNQIIDHINKDKLDNRLDNLRFCSNKENSYNSKKKKNNTTGFVGVYFNKNKNKYRAYINLDYKQINLGYYSNLEEAIKARLYAEKKYYKEFAPQIDLFEKYGIKNDLVCNVEKKQQKSYLKEILSRLRLVKKLGSTNAGMGEDQFLTGVIVQFDIYAPLYMWKEIQRYHFLDFISSQSTMHKLAQFKKIKNHCVADTDEQILNRYQELLDDYNNSDFDKQKWRTLVASLPCGFVLGATMTTNYRQLKTIYNQRKNHKLKEWHDFCEWCEKLPFFKMLCIDKDVNSDDKESN